MFRRDLNVDTNMSKAVNKTSTVEVQNPSYDLFICPYSLDTLLI